MPRDFAAAARDIESVLKDYDDALQRGRSETESVRLITILSTCIERWAPAHSTYRKPLDVPYTMGAGSLLGKMSVLNGALLALRDDFKAGRMVALAELIHGELFSDYLDMAKHLLDQGYKDAAAVIVGSTLEAHLRALCAKHAMLTTLAGGRPKKASAMNDELKAAGAYDLGDQKQVTAWLDLRNDAAHGDYGKYDAPRVTLMRDGVQNFIVRVPG